MKNAITVTAAVVKTATKAPVKTATNKKAIVVVSPVVPVVTATPATAKIEMVSICKTNYGYYRYWVKDIMSNAGILKFRFVKNKENYDGTLAVSKKEVEKAKAALAKYVKDNPTTVSMWSF